VNIKNLVVNNQGASPVQQPLEYICLPRQLSLVEICLKHLAFDVAVLRLNPMSQDLDDSDLNRIHSILFYLHHKFGNKKWSNARLHMYGCAFIEEST
jgi:hypothetical protein